MELKDFMNGRTPDPTYVAQTADTSDAYIVAVDLERTGDPTKYIVANMGISEQSGSINPKTVDSEYVHSGQTTSKTGTARQIAISGDRFSGDPFQDAVLSYKVKFGVGNDTVYPYVYFNALTGEGEKGVASIIVEDDTSGSAGENATFSATLYAQGTPAEYTYSATPTP